MRLKYEIIRKINNPKTRIKLALLLDCTEQTIRKYIHDNSANLTKYDVLNLLSKELNTEIENLIENTYEPAN